MSTHDKVFWTLAGICLSLIVAAFLTGSDLWGCIGALVILIGIVAFREQT